jgi:hypothetical protein
MRHYDTLAEYDREGFRIIVDKTWEDIHPRDCFDEGDVDDICERIDRGDLDWFMLRVRVLVDDVELGTHYLGGCCYEDAREVLTDGIAEDSIWDAMHEAKQRLTTLAQKFTMMAIKHS